MMDNTNMENIIKALQGIRIRAAAAEHDIQNAVAAAFGKAGIPFAKEYRLGKGDRVDFLSEGVAVEVKKGKPNRARLAEQIERYAKYGEVDAVVIVVETSLYNPIERTSDGKPCAIVGLQKLWGIAL